MRMEEYGQSDASVHLADVKGKPQKKKKRPPPLKNPTAAQDERHGKTKPPSYDYSHEKWQDKKRDRPKRKWRRLFTKDNDKHWV